MEVLRCHLQLATLQGLLSQSLPHSATPVRSRTAHALPQSASGTPTVPTAPTKPREAQSAQALPPGPSSQAQSAIPISTRAAVAASAPTLGGGQKAMPSDAVHTRALSAQPAASDSGRQVGSTAWGRPTGAVAQYTQAGQFGFVASGRQSGTDRAASMQAREAAHEAGQAVNAQQPASQAQQVCFAFELWVHRTPSGIPPSISTLKAMAMFSVEMCVEQCQHCSRTVLHCDGLCPQPCRRGP